MSDFKSQVDRELSEVCMLLEIPVLRSWSDKGSQHDFTIRLKELPSPIGLEIRVSDNFLVWHFETSLDAFARPTIELSNQVFKENHEAIIDYCRAAESKSNKFTFLVNGKQVTELDTQSTWTDFKIVMSRPYQSMDFSMQTLRQSLIDLFGLLTALTRRTDEDALKEIDPLEFKEEGAETVQLCRKYERSRFNRDLCLSYFGYRCVACGASLDEIYGEAGLKVIHVHHITPVSLMDKPKVLNPIQDLAPLCPNCHNVVHRKNPPYTLEELKGFLRPQSQQ